jgi:hypothetical protein
MSLETSIAALTTQAGMLLDLPQQIQTAASQQIVAIAAEYQSRIQGLFKEVYLDQVTGNDANSGAIESPFKTLAKAVSVVPSGGRVHVLMLADYELDATVLIVNRQVMIQSPGATRRNLTFQRYSTQVGPSTQNGLRHFQLYDGSTLECDNMKITMPPIDGNWGVNPIAPWAAFRPGYQSRAGGLMYVGLFSCEVVLPATPFNPLFDRLGGMIALNVQSTLVSGQPLNGKLFAEATSGAGTPTGNFPWLITNLTTI